MKLTKSLVRQFESEQKEYGTETTLRNLLWLLASEILHGIGVTRIRTTYRKPK